MPSLLDEVQDLDAASLRFARGIDYATAGAVLSPFVERGLAQHGGLYGQVRAAVSARLDQLGGAGEKQPLFMLAADMATTAQVARDQLTAAQQVELRALWEDMRTQ